MGGFGIGALVIAALRSRESITFAGIFTIVSSLFGAALTVYWTKGMRGERTQKKLASGALINLNKGDWSVDLPIPMIMPTTVSGETQKMGVKVSIPIASGRWQWFCLRIF